MKVNELENNVDCEIDIYCPNCSEFCFYHESKRRIKQEKMRKRLK